MKRKPRIILTIGALLGAVATGFLVVALLGDSGDERIGRAADRGASSRDESSRFRGGVTVQKVTDERIRRERNASMPLGTMIRSGSRQPMDSALTVAERSRMSLEVLEILQTIRTNDQSKRSQNQALYNKLVKHVRKLGRHMPRETRNELVSMIDSVDPTWRRLIGATLGNLTGDVETAQMLLTKLEARPENLYTRQALLLALENMEVKEVLPSLLRMLGDGHDQEDRIVRAIGRIGGRGATDTLLKYLDRNAVNRTTAREIERILGAGGDPVVLRKVAKGLESNSVNKRVSMLHVLGSSRSAEHAPVIRDLLAGETDPRVKSAAIRALGNIGDEQSGQMLLDLAQGSDPTTANQAINAIHSIRNGATVTALASRWDRLDDRARYAVMGAAARISRPDDKVIQIAHDSLSDDNERVRNYAARVLGQSRNEKHVEVLGSYLRSARTARERSVAIAALERIGTEKAAEEVLRSVNTLPERQRGQVRERFQRIAEQRAKVRTNSQKR